MLKNDYLGEPIKYSYPGIDFYYDSWKEKYNKGIMKVNGHIYYDIRYALNEYEDGIKEKETQVFSLNSRIRELKDDLEKLNKDFPKLKQAIKEWMEYQKESEDKE